MDLGHAAALALVPLYLYGVMKLAHFIKKRLPEGRVKSLLYRQFGAYPWEGKRGVERRDTERTP